MHREPSEHWPPAPTSVSPVPDEPKPRLLTGNKGWDEAIGWLGGILLTRSSTIFYGNSFAFVDNCLHRLGIDPFAFPNLVLGLALGGPLVEMLSIALLVYFVLRPSFPMLAKSFGQSLLFMVILGAGVGLCIGVWAHFSP